MILIHKHDSRSPLPAENCKQLKDIQFYNMPMKYKAGAQGIKPALLAPPNVFLEDTFTRYIPPWKVLINSATMPINQFQPDSTALKLARNSCTHTLMTR
jgi:hypothetical protein